jgi:hypothetical protein
MFVSKLYNKGKIREDRKIEKLHGLNGCSKKSGKQQSCLGSCLDDPTQRFHASAIRPLHNVDGGSGVKG